MLRFRSILCAFAGGLLGLLGGPSAHATPMSLMFGSANGPNGFTANLFSKGPNSAQFNPSRLIWSHQALELGFFVVSGDLKIDLKERPDGIDISTSIYNVRVENEDGSLSRLDHRPLPTELLAPRKDTHRQPLSSFVTLGLARHIVPDRVVLGVFAMVPVDKVQGQRAYFSDEREQFFSNRLDFELMGDRLELTTLSLGLGAAIRDWLSIGVGLSMELSTESVTRVYVPDSADQSLVLINSEIQAKSVFIPHAALTIQPTQRLQLTSTVHAAWNAEFDGENQVTLWNYDYPDDGTYILQEFDFVHGYRPLTVDFGMAYEIGSQKSRHWNVGAYGRWSRWSKYRDRHGERPLDTWNDVFSFGLGIQTTSPTTDMNFSLRYDPSPIPNQDGRSNYVDNDRMGVSLGWRKTVRAWGHRISLGLSAQFQFLVPRSVEKSEDAENPVFDEFPDKVVDVFTGENVTEGEGFQTNNPGYPGYSSRGWLLGFGANVYIPF